MIDADKLLWANGRLRLLVTAMCNLSCFYCHNEGQSKGASFLQQDLFDHLLRLVASAPSSLAAVTFSGGEPLLHPELDSYIARFAEYVEHRTLVTNGLLLTRQRTAALRRAGVTKIRLGVDSLQKDRSRPSRVVGSHQRIANVIAMVEDAGIPLELNVVLSRFNLREIPDLIEYCFASGHSAKFFELIREVAGATRLEKAVFEATPVIGFTEFHRMLLASGRFSSHGYVPGLKQANYEYRSERSRIVYCNYLCEFGLCGKTGTRVDHRGAISACMEHHSIDYLIPGERLAYSQAKLKRIAEAGCESNNVTYVRAEVAANAGRQQTVALG